MQKIDEAKVKRITKKVDGIPARTQRAHCRYSEIRPLIATNINSIVDGIFNLSLENGKEYPLNRQIDVTLQNIHIYFYTDVPNFEDTGIVPDDFDKSKIVTNPDDGRPEYPRNGGSNLLQSAWKNTSRGRIVAIVASHGIL